MDVILGNKFMNVIERYNQELNIDGSDINEHLPILREYAEKCDTITEMGVRFVVSTYAFTIANPKKIVSIDIIHPNDHTERYGVSSSYRLKEIENYCTDNNIIFQFIKGDTKSIEIEETDLLFIDTLHTYQQLKAELNLHSNKVKKYIILHDTFSFAHTDDGGNTNCNPCGILPALNEFLKDNNNWSIHKVYENNNGLTILERK